jgi:O-antigen ligase
LGVEESDGSTGGIDPRRSAIAQWTLLIVAGWCVWRPVETFPFSAILVAAVVLGLAVWAWRRTPKCSNPWLIAGVAGSALLASGVTGWDPASAIVEIALLTAAVTLMWLASRASPPEEWPAVLGLVISALALWGLWQVAGGMEQASAAIGQLPVEIQAAAAERLASGRAFASQLLPSHLAVLLATALPLLLWRLRPRWSTVPWAVGAVLCVVGLVLTRSPVGAALALGACGTLALGRKKRLLIWVALLLVSVLVVVVLGRGDVVELEPVQLRLDNWRTAVWVWSTAPAVGVGMGGFAQAAQAVPFEVGNRPRHAHSLALEWLAELGPVGLLAVVVAGLALWRLLRRLWPVRPELAVALAVIPAHNLVDFSFYGSGVTLAWAVLVGWAMALVSASPEPQPVPARGRVIFVTAVAAALAVTILHVTSLMVEESAAARETPSEKLDRALEARRLAPWRVDPLGLVATAALETGEPQRLSEARAELDRGRWLRPHSSALAGLRAQVAAAEGLAPTAVSEAWISASEQPSDAARAENLESLLNRLESGAEDDGS